MRSTALLPLLLALGYVGACSSPAPSDADTTSLQGDWASDQVSLTITGDTANLTLLASGGCFGSYGQIPQPIPLDHFSLPGTYTQLIGAYPGKLEYPAEYAGQVSGGDLALTITVPALQLTLGPVHLTAGREQSWPACLYP